MWRAKSTHRAFWCGNFRCEVATRTSPLALRDSNGARRRDYFEKFAKIAFSLKTFKFVLVSLTRLARHVRDTDATHQFDQDSPGNEMRFVCAANFARGTPRRIDSIQYLEFTSTCAYLYLLRTWTHALITIVYKCVLIAENEDSRRLLIVVKIDQTIVSETRKRSKY